MKTYSITGTANLFGVEVFQHILDIISGYEEWIWVINRKWVHDGADGFLFLL